MSDDEGASPDQRPPEAETDAERPPEAEAHAERPPEPAPPAELPPPAKRWIDRARLARLVALAGILAVVLVGRSLVLPHLPVRHDVQLRLESPADVTALDIRWSPPGSDEDIVTTSLHFSPGHAPSTVPADVRLPAGTYDVTITVERTSRTDVTRRRITLEDDAHVTIPLR